MTVILLGGAPGANWTPLLLPLVAIFLILAGSDKLVRFIKAKFRHNH